MTIYKSNIDLVLSKLKSTLSPEKMDSMFLEMAQNMYRSNLQRVHSDGKAVSGGLIGHYSHNPLYVNPVKAGTRKFPLKGKTGKTKFKNGKRHVTGYFKGYGQFKQTIGFGTKVNMQVTGRLKADFVLQKSRRGYVIGFRSVYGKDISIGNEEHFHTKIWGITSQDRKQNIAIVKRYLNNAKH